MVYGIESGDFYRAALLVMLAYGIFLVGYLVDRERHGAQRIRVAARTAVHVLMALTVEHFLREEGFSPTGLAILAGMGAVAYVLGRVLPKEDEPEVSYAPLRGDRALEPPHFAGRRYEPGISPFA